MSRKCKKTIFDGCLVANVFTILKWHLLIIVAVIGLLTLRPANVEAVSYTFVDIANTNVAPFGIFSGGPSINNNGTVAFWAAQNGAANAPAGIFTGDDDTATNVTTTIADNTTISDLTGNTFTTKQENPDINDNGTVVFVSNDGSSGQGVVTGSGGATTTIYHTLGVFNNLTGNPAINNGGTTAFYGARDSGGAGIFSGNGGPHSTIVDNDTVDGGVFGLSIKRSPDINVSGTVVFNAPLDAGGERISTGIGAGTNTIVDTNVDPFSSLGYAPSINNGGIVAFQGVHNTLGQGIFTDSGGLTTIADSTGAFSFFGGSPSINNNGLVAFSAGLDVGGQGIFTGSDPIADLVIKTGDALFGSTLLGLDFGHHGLNDSGQIAFRYTLANFTQGIAIASAVQAVPEPTTIALLGIGLAGLAGAAVRRRLKTMSISSPRTAGIGMMGYAFPGQKTPLPVRQAGRTFPGLIVSFLRKRYRQLRPITDYGISIIALIVASPVLLVVAIMIKITSSGPVFYTQSRMGRNGRLFNIIKFRTMYVGAESQTGPVWTKENDPRVTSIGRFLRRTHIDELPQFINVLKGEMSIIGPRPERPFFADKFKDEIHGYTRRLSVKPGITGLAQCCRKYDETVNDVKKKLRYDILYIKRMCWMLDIKILLKTLSVSLLRIKTR